MYNIAVQRLPEDPECQGVVRAQDGSWQVVIDKDGFPHLWIRVKGEPGKDGKPVSGLIPLDMFFADGVSVKDLMLSEFGGEITDESELAQANAEWLEIKERLGIPCPK